MDYDSTNLTPTPTVGRNFVNYINRAYSAAGAIPSTMELEQIINGEMNKAYRRKIEGESFVQGKGEFYKGMEETEKDRVTKSATGMLGGVAELGANALLGFPGYYRRPTATGLDPALTGGAYGY